MSASINSLPLELIFWAASIPHHSCALFGYRFEGILCVTSFGTMRVRYHDSHGQNPPNLSTQDWESAYKDYLPASENLQRLQCVGTLSPKTDASITQAKGLQMQYTPDGELILIK